MKRFILHMANTYGLTVDEGDGIAPVGDGVGVGVIVVVGAGVLVN
jgi:hypothetical protein